TTTSTTTASEGSCSTTTCLSPSGVVVEIGTPAVPPPRCAHDTARVGHLLYTFGGWNQSKMLNDVYIFSTVTHTWTRPPCKGLVYPRAGMLDLFSLYPSFADTYRPHSECCWRVVVHLCWW